MFYFLGFNRILIVAAILPAIILLLKVYQADRLEREPVGLLVSLVFLGIVSTLIAMVCEGIGETILSRAVPANSLIYYAIMYFGIVAFSEEGAKYLMLKKRTWCHPAFNCQFDGMVYAIFTSLGFALWENIGYVLANGLGTALIRAITAVPGHACFGVFMGAFYGLAKRAEREGRLAQSGSFRILAVLLPAFLHGCYDFIAATGYRHSIWAFIIFVIILFVISFRMVRKMAQEDRYI